MKSINFKIKETNGKCYNVKMSLTRDFSKTEVLNSRATLIADVKKDFPKADTIDMLVPITQKRFTKKQLEQVGTEEASTWGAEYLGHTCYENFVEFKAIECGDRFVFDMTYDDIAKSI